MALAMAATVPLGLMGGTGTGKGAHALRVPSTHRCGFHRAGSAVMATCSMRPGDNESVQGSSGSDSRPRPCDILGRTAFAAVAAALLLVSPGDALAASGGRVGGSAFKSSQRSAPAPSRTYNNSRTNIYIQPPPLVGPPPVVIAPPAFGGYGYGFGGFGVPFFSPSPPVVVAPSVAIGFSLFDVLPFVVFLAVIGAISNLFRRRNDYDD